ncbi:Alpha-ketoglutarate-dependent taurine dioxygenase [Gammaproteobacteria bacterium MOLA455]|nr:Alpha-ketoglutarate-dependent taurine dioxygenase [Gammaproteobacteria bacterium MOLA455]
MALLPPSARPAPNQVYCDDATLDTGCTFLDLLLELEMPHKERHTDKKDQLMTFTVSVSGQACGASIDGLDLSQPLDSTTIGQIRAAWLEHHVVCFPDQSISDDDLERFSQYFGEFAGDPYIASLKDRKNIIQLRRTADEQTPIFADAWHTDWSFGEKPPAATILYGITIPPQGGHTSFINQHKALAAMPENLLTRIRNKVALHSAQKAYAPDGAYGDQEKDGDRGFTINCSDSAYAVQPHPLIRRHPETGEECLYGCLGYIIGIEGMSDEESMTLLSDLYLWQTREEFQYQHQWKAGMLVMWDNRSLLHKANGGYQGHERVLHRTVVG